MFNLIYLYCSFKKIYTNKLKHRSSQGLTALNKYKHTKVNLLTDLKTDVIRFLSSDL